ncbi:hypothetical protein [Moraxella lacunata]
MIETKTKSPVFAGLFYAQPKSFLIKPRNHCLLSITILDFLNHFA